MERNVRETGIKLNSWGKPFKTSFSDGAKYISFQDETAKKSTDPQGGCITTFILIDGMVDNYEIEGKECGVENYID